MKNRRLFKHFVGPVMAITALLTVAAPAGLDVVSASAAAKPTASVQTVVAHPCPKRGTCLDSSWGG